MVGDSRPRRNVEVCEEWLTMMVESSCLKKFAETFLPIASLIYETRAVPSRELKSLRQQARAVENRWHDFA